MLILLRLELAVHRVSYVRLMRVGMSGVNEVTSDREGDGEEINEFIIAVERY
jgi:hypothetical protein